MRGVRGFTLMEVLVALVLLTLFTLTSYRALDSVLNAQRHATAELERWHERATAFAAMDSDLSNAVARFDPRDVQRSGFHARLGQDGNAQFDLVRLLPEDADQGVARIGYRCDKNGLTRLVWPDTDNVAIEPRATLLLGGLTTCALQYLDGHGQWLPAWLSRISNPLPVAVELRIGTADGIPIRRVFHVQ
jgi:general secretion pathway protein J